MSKRNKWKSGPSSYGALHVYESFIQNGFNPFKPKVPIVGQRQTVQTQIIHRRAIRVFPVPYSDKHIVSSSPENQHFIEIEKRFEILDHSA